MEETLVEKNTDELLNILVNQKPGDTEKYESTNEGELFSGEKPFSSYIRELLKAHGKTQQEVIARAGFSDKYGYALLAERKHTVRRDTLLRICLAGEFTLSQTQRVLRLYGMNELYPRIPRDAVLITFIGNGETDLSRINESLSDKGFAPIPDGREE